MFEITPKEQILKNVRKGLVQPVANMYPLLDTDTPSLHPAHIPADETFLKQYTGKGNFFAVCDNIFNFMTTLLKLQQQHNWPVIGCSDKHMTDLLKDNGISVSTAEKDYTVFLSPCQKLSADQNTVYFSSEFHNLKAIDNSKVLLIYAAQKQIEPAGAHSVFNELSVKRDLRIAFDLSEPGPEKSVYLFLNVNS